MASKSVSFSVTLVSTECAPLACDVTVAELRGSLLPNSTGHRGWDDAICSDCGESAAWCTDLAKHLPVAFVSERRSA